LYRVFFCKGGFSIAATWIRPRHISAGKTVAQTISDGIDYAENPDKTQQGDFVTAYGCNPRLADAEFLLSRRQYADATGRNQGKSDILLYHIRQSFKPGEITPEDANRIGRELAMRFTHGKHAFIVATHVDQHHIHSHIIFNPVNLECTGKFKNPLRSNKIIRRISDHICLENGLSVIENPMPSRGKDYSDWMGGWRGKLEQLIDKILAGKPGSFEEFIKLLEAEKCEVKVCKYTSVRMEGQKKFTRLKSLSPDYTEDAIRERISGARIVTPKEKPAPAAPPPSAFMIDFQNRIRALKENPVTQGAKIFNIKQIASSFMFMQENGIPDIEGLRDRVQAAKDDLNRIVPRVSAIDARMAAINELQKHIGAYIKTKDVFAGYRKAGYSKKYLEEHRAAIETCKAAKRFFDAQNLKKLPTIPKLKQEFAALLDEKKKLQAELKPMRAAMQEILIIEQNIRDFYGLRDTQPRRETDRQGR